MNIIVNGEQQKIEENNLTVASLLKINDVDMPDMVSVQLNGEFVDKDAYGSTPIIENNEIDFLYFMGGGSK